MYPTNNIASAPLPLPSQGEPVSTTYERVLDFFQTFGMVPPTNLSEWETTLGGHPEYAEISALFTSILGSETPSTRAPDEVQHAQFYETHLPPPAMGESVDQVGVRVSEFLRNSGGYLPNNLGDWEVFLALPEYTAVNVLFQTAMDSIAEERSITTATSEAVYEIDEACRLSPLTVVAGEINHIRALPSYLRANKIQAALEMLKPLEKESKAQEFIKQLRELQYNLKIGGTFTEGTRAQVGNPCTEASAIFLRNQISQKSRPIDSCLVDGERLHGHGNPNAAADLVVQDRQISPYLSPYPMSHLSGSISEEAIAEIVATLVSLPDHSGVFITAQGKTFALERNGDNLCFFDSHGEPTRQPLKAYTLQFKDPEDMIHFLIQKIKRHDIGNNIEDLSEEEKKLIDEDHDVNSFTTLFVSSPAIVATYVPHVIPLPPVRVNYDAGFGNSLCIRSAPHWGVSHPMECLGGSVWQAKASLPEGTEYKICFNGTVWEEGSNRVAGREDPARGLTFPS